MSRSKATAFDWAAPLVLCRYLGGPRFRAYWPVESWKARPGRSADQLRSGYHRSVGVAIKIAGDARRLAACLDLHGPTPVGSSPDAS